MTDKVNNVKIDSWFDIYAIGGTPDKRHGLLTHMTTMMKYRPTYYKYNRW